MEDRRDPSESAVRRRKGGNLTEAGARLLDESESERESRCVRRREMPEPE